MGNILEKMESYQILTNIVPGAYFFFCFNYLVSSNISAEGVLNQILFCYFAGLVINRIGSLGVEPLLKKLCFVKFAPYPDFVNAKIKDPSIEQLSGTNNQFRSLFTATLCVPVAWGIYALYSGKVWQKLLMLTALAVLFLLSYKKQTSYVRKRVESINK